MKYRETEGAKVRRLGFALDEATLKQLAYSKGITQSYESMTQAQKAQLRYVAMIEQAQNIGVTGDMSRTIDTASNGVRVLEARIQQFTRALGNMLMPVLSALLPYFTAFVQVLTEAANGIANFLGFELPKIDLSGVSNGYDDIAGAADEATAATEKFKGSLAGVDQLNIIGSHTNNSGSGTGYSTDLDIELPTYDFLNGVESKTKEIAENIRKWFKEALPWIEAVGAGIAGAFAPTIIATAISKVGAFITKIGALVKWFKQLQGFQKVFYGFSGGLAAGASSGVLLYNSVKNLIRGTGDLASNWTQLAAGIGIVGGAIAAFIALGNPAGAVITLVGSLTGAMIGCTTAVRELTDETYKSVFYSDVGTSIQNIADKYSAWADEITKTDDKVAQNQQAIEANKKTIEDSLGTLDDLAKSFEASGNMSEEAAGKIKEASESMSNAISSNLTTELNNVILGIGDSWDTVAEKAGLAKDEIINALYAEKNQGNEALTALNKQMSSAVETLSTAKKGTAEYEAALEDYRSAQDKYAKIANASLGSESKEYIDQQLSALSSDKIALMDKSTAKSALAQINDSYKTAVEKMTSTKTSSLSSLETLQAQLKALGVDTNDAIYAGAHEGIEENYKSRIDELNFKTSEIISSLNQRIDELNAEAGTQAIADLKNRAETNPFDGSNNLNDFISKNASKIGAETDLTLAWWRGALGGTDVESVLRGDYEDRNGVSDLKKSVEEINADIAATAAMTVTREAKSQGPTVQHDVGYARDALTSVLDEYSVKNASDNADITPQEINIYTTIEMGDEEVANAVNRVSNKQMTYSNGHGW